MWRRPGQPDRGSIAFAWKTPSTRTNVPHSRRRRNRILALAKDLAADGLSSADRTELERRAHSIGAAHGDPHESNVEAGSPRHIALLAGAPLVVIGIVWAVRSRMRRSPNR